PAGDGWVVQRLVDAACTAGKQGALEPEAVFLRRALAEPPPLGDRSALLLDLGMAEASAGLADGPEHLQQAVEAAPDPEAAAAADPAAPAELLAAAAFISVLENEPAEGAAELASRALQAGDSAPRGSGGRQWVSSIGWFSQSAFTLLWSERYAQLRPLLDASIAQARATGDSTRLAMGLAVRSWLALRSGELSAAEADART